MSSYKAYRTIQEAMSEIKPFRNDFLTTFIGLITIIIIDLAIRLARQKHSRTLTLEWIACNR